MMTLSQVEAFLSPADARFAQHPDMKMETEDAKARAPQHHPSEILSQRRISAW